MPEQKIPAWLDAAVDQKLALMQDLMPVHLAALVTGADALFVYLTEPDDDVSEEERAAWAFRCDNCGKVDPMLHTGHMSRVVEGVHVVIAMGACADCLAVD